MTMWQTIRFSIIVVIIIIIRQWAECDAETLERHVVGTKIIIIKIIIIL
jgi:hypothetical protein